MANNFRNPWTIDTASANVIHAGVAYVKGIVFQGYSAAGDQCVVKHRNGAQTVVTMTGTSDLSPVTFEFCNPVPLFDLSVPTLSSGYCQIYVE